MRIGFLSGAYSVHTVRWLRALLARGYEMHLITITRRSSMCQGSQFISSM